MPNSHRRFGSLDAKKDTQKNAQKGVGWVSFLAAVRFFWSGPMVSWPAADADGASNLLKKGTGSEPTGVNAAKSDRREVPVPLFQQAARVAQFLLLKSPAQ
jgi:hypothetical protein